jgi:hypothetical protein
MSQSVIEGTWEEILSQSDSLMGRRVRLEVLPEQEGDGSKVKPPIYSTATHEEFVRAFDALGEQYRHLPVLPPEAFERESLYADDDDSG